MARLTRSQWARIAVGFQIVPPTLMVALDHAVLGAATLGGVLAASTLQEWLWVRAERDSQRTFLSYAQDSTTMGGNPTPVIAALRAGDSSNDEDESQLGAQPRGYDPPRHVGHEYLGSR